MTHIYKTPAEVLTAIAGYFVKVADDAIKTNERFTVALSGGSSPKGLYELLASDEYRLKVEWSKVYFFFGDERNVPADYPDNNALMAKKALFEPLHIAPEQIFAIDTSRGPEAAATDYQKTMEAFFAPGKPVLDLVLLGLGDNSHTASLFPGTDVLNATEAGIKEVYLSDQQVYRITMTAPLINEAHNVAFLVYGSGKAEAVHHIMQGAKDYNQYPAQLIQPAGGEADWFMDEGAASAIQGKLLK